MRKRSGLGLLMVAAAFLPGYLHADTMGATDRAKSGTFDASGDVACAQEVGEPMGTCTAEVARDGDAATVVVTFQTGFSRMLMFDGGAFLRGNTTMSGTGTDTDWRLVQGVHEIRVDDQRFDIPEALIAGD